MVRGYSQGCHRCGGYPGHKTKDRGYLVECVECGTITCNEHIPIGGGCAQCGSKKSRKVMTRADVKKRRKGSKVKGVSTGQRGGTSQVDMGDENNQQRPFAGGGSDLPSKKSASGPTLNRQPSSAEQPDVRRIQERMQEILGTENSNSQMPHSIPDMPKRGGQNEQSITASSSEDTVPQGAQKDQGNKSQVSSSSQHESTSQNETSATKNSEVSTSQLYLSSSDPTQTLSSARHEAVTSDGQKVDMTSASVSDRQNSQDNGSFTHQKNEQMSPNAFSKTENDGTTHNPTMHQAAEVDEDSDGSLSQSYAIEQGEGHQQVPQPTLLITSPAQGVNQLTPGAPGSLQEEGKLTMHQAAEVAEDYNDPQSRAHARDQGDGSQLASQPTLLITSPEQGVNQLMSGAPGSLQDKGKPTMHQAAEVDEDSANSAKKSQTQLGKMPATYKKKTQYEIDMEEFDADVDDLFDNGFLGHGNVTLHSETTDNLEKKEFGQKYNPPNNAELNDFSQQSEEDIEREFEALEDARKKDLSQSNSIEYMKELANKDRHQISECIHLADAFWCLNYQGLDSVKDALNYAQSIDKLHRKSKQSYENPDVMMSVLLYQPTTHDMRFNVKALKKIASLPRIEPAIGFAPSVADKLEPEKVTQHINQIIEQIRHPIAIGLIGLDKHYSPYTIDAQKSLFETQLKIAAEQNMPVYITARKAEEFLAESLDKVLTKNHPPLIMTDLINTQEKYDLVNAYDMHICLRPELTHESNKLAVEFTREVNPARWMLCNGYSHSAPKGRELGLNKPEYLPETATQIGDLLKRTDEDLRTLCTGNMARLFFNSPWRSEKGQKEDIWSDFR